jgi:hypothetical protein
LSGRPWSGCPELVLEFEIEKESKSRSSWGVVLFSVIHYASARAYEGDLSLIDVCAISAAAIKIPYNSKADRNQISCGRFLRMQVEVDDGMDEMLPFCICSRVLR